MLVIQKGNIQSLKRLGRGKYTSFFVGGILNCKKCLILNFLVEMDASMLFYYLVNDLLLGNIFVRDLLCIFREFVGYIDLTNFHQILPKYFRNNGKQKCVGKF